MKHLSTDQQLLLSKKNLERKNNEGNNERKNHNFQTANLKAAEFFIKKWAIPDLF